jgi:superfamily II DNA or RNA helicase
MNRIQIKKAIENCNPRRWQGLAFAECLNLLKTKQICVVEAVTGGGKTFFAAMVASQLLADGDIDEIVILAPSTSIKEGWSSTFSEKFCVDCTSSDYTTSGVSAFAVHYAGIDNIGVREKLAARKRRLLIVDEFHHAERDATWGVAVQSVIARCNMAIFLSGTPWRTDGEISVLRDNGYYENGHIKADVQYRYAEDLVAIKDQRGTVYAEFTFVDSHAKNKDTGEELKLVAPTDGELSALSNKEDNQPLGPHVRIHDSSISNNKMARNMLQVGSSKLETAMRETKGRAIGLVVTRNISEARCVANYLTEVLDQKAEVIASDDSAANERLRSIKREDRNRSPDWIVSVGMVSEGVDIPQIKVVVYLSAITTLLYLIQVVGRAIRRINISKNGVEYIDKYPGQTPGYIVMPAHPFLIWLAEQFENDKRVAEQHRKKIVEPGDGGDTRDPSNWDNLGGGNAAEVFGGKAQCRALSRMLDLLAADHDARKIVNESYIACVREWIRSGMIAHVESELKSLCERFRIDAKEQDFEKQIDFDTRVRLARKDAQRLTGLIRFSHAKFKDSKSKDDSRIYQIIRGEINKRCGISSFDKATLEQKEKWVAAAEAMYREGLRRG